MKVFTNFWKPVCIGLSLIRTKEFYSIFINKNTGLHWFALKRGENFEVFWMAATQDPGVSFLLVGLDGIMGSASSLRFFRSYRHNHFGLFFIRAIVGMLMGR